MSTGRHYSAVAGEPKLLILDEPTSALDPLMTAEVLELIFELKKEGKTFIFSTHHLNLQSKLLIGFYFFPKGLFGAGDPL